MQSALASANAYARWVLAERLDVWRKGDEWSAKAQAA